jgi:hypothetical protein
MAIDSRADSFRDRRSGTDDVRLVALVRDGDLAAGAERRVGRIEDGVGGTRTDHERGGIACSLRACGALRLRIHHGEAGLRVVDEIDAFELPIAVRVRARRRRHDALARHQSQVAERSRLARSGGRRRRAGA